MQLQDNDVKELIKVIDWAIMEGYGGLKGPEHAMQLLNVMVEEIDANKDSDNYFKETYGF